LNADDDQLKTLLERRHIEPAKGLWFDGAWHVGATQIPVINPAAGETLADTGLAGADAFAAAIDDAHTAFLSCLNKPARSRRGFCSAASR